MKYNGKEMVFVFSSNLAGVHSSDEAKVARFEYGAELGIGIGRTGNAYAVPTKDRNIHTMSKCPIRFYVNEFLKYAAAHPDELFQVTRIGCELAEFSDRDIAPMFKGAPKNCIFDDAWRSWMGDSYEYWGHTA